MGIRPEDIHNGDSFDEDPIFTRVRADIELIEMVGAETFLYLNVENNSIIARVDSKKRYSLAKNVEFLFDTTRLHLFDKVTQQAI